MTTLTSFQGRHGAAGAEFPHFGGAVGNGHKLDLMILDIQPARVGYFNN